MQIKALKGLKEMAQLYGYDISQPAKNAREAVQWLYFGYLGAVKTQNGAAMSVGRISTFLDIYIQRDLNEGTLTEDEAQELIDHLVMKFRMVKFARIPSYNELFTGDPVWATLEVGGMGQDGRSMVTKNDFRFLHTLENMGPSPEPNLTVLYSSRLPKAFKHYASLISVKTSSIQYENDDVSLRHERHDPGREGGDAAQSSHNHKTRDGSHNGRRHFRIETKRLVPSQGNRIALHAWAEKARGKNRDDGKRPSVGLELQASLNVKGRTAAILSFNALLVDLAERRLHKSGRRTKKGHHPHPEKRTGAAEADGRGHACNVAGADTPGERQRERLKARKSDLVLLLLKEQAPHLWEQAKLDKTRPDGKKQAGAQTKGHKRGRPNDGVEGVDEVFHADFLC